MGFWSRRATRDGGREALPRMGVDRPEPAVRPSDVMVSYASQPLNLVGLGAKLF